MQVWERAVRPKRGGEGWIPSRGGGIGPVSSSVLMGEK